MEINEKAIRDLMNEHGWSITRFAAELGARRTWVSALLNGRKRPSGKFIGQFMKRFPEKDLKKYFWA